LFLLLVVECRYICFCLLVFFLYLVLHGVCFAFQDNLYIKNIHILFSHFHKILQNVIVCIDNMFFNRKNKKVTVKAMTEK